MISTSLVKHKLASLLALHNHMHNWESSAGGEKKTLKVYFCQSRDRLRAGGWVGVGSIIMIANVSDLVFGLCGGGRTS